MKTLRKLILAFVLILVICIAAIAAIAYFMNPNQLKPIIISQVAKQTGYEMTIDGNLAWSFFPVFNIKIPHVLIKAPKQTATFLDLKNVRMASDFRAALKGERIASGDIYIDHIEFMNVKAEKAHIGLRWASNVLTIDPIKADFYDGKLSGIAHGKQLSQTPAWDWDLVLAGINISPLLKDSTRGNSKIDITGRGELQIKAATVGLTRTALFNNLNGKARFALADGVVKGVDVNYLVSAADAILNKQGLPMPTTNNETVFSGLTGTAVISHGILITNDLLLTSPTFVTQGAGKVDLETEAVNIALKIKSQETVKTGWQIPILIAGNLKQPIVRLDTIAIQKVILAKELDKLKTSVSKEVSKLPDSTNQFLKKLIGN